MSSAVIRRGEGRGRVSSARAGLAPGRLLAEVTETAVLDAGGVDAVRQLHELGLRVARRHGTTISVADVVRKSD